MDKAHDSVKEGIAVSAKSLHSRLVGGFGGAGGALVGAPILQVLLGFEWPLWIFVTFESLGFLLMVIAIVLHVRAPRLELEKDEVGYEEDYEDTVKVAKALKRLNEWKKEATKRGNDLITLEIPLSIINWIDKKMAEKGLERRSQTISDILADVMNEEKNE